MQSEPNNRKFSAFLSIPYAQPPLGNLRFQPPVENEEFYKPHDPLDATKYKTDCAQLVLKSLDFKGSEDCLHLNVFTPDFKFNGNTNLPVMVWIHGGAFLFGGSDPSFYGPQRLLDYDVIVVSINYRLGALGFLTIGAESNPANIGIMDQIMALNWVKNNIKFFGGDPERVTIFGESAGGESVIALLSSPRASGLFSQAISMSGTYGFQNIFLHNSRKIPHYASLLASELSCDILKTPEDTINCLREKPVEEILGKANLFVQYNFLNNPFKPVPDPEAANPVLPYKQNDLWSGNSSFDVPLLIGGNKDEGIMSFIDFLGDDSLFAPVETQFFIQGPILLLSTDPDVAEREESESATAESIKRKYLGDKKFSKEASKEIINMLTDVHYLSQIDYAVKKLSAKKTTPTYYYNYQHQGSFSVPMAFGHMEPLGVCHADEIFLLFRNDDVSKSWLGDMALQTEEDILVSRKLLELWTEFAVSGKPSTDRVWKPVDAENVKYAVLDSKEIRMEYPKDFSDRMLFVQNMIELVNNHRNFDLEEHPALKQMREDMMTLAKAEMEEEVDWNIKSEKKPAPSEDVDMDNLDKELEEELNKALPSPDDPRYNIEEGNVDAAMKLLMDLEDEAGAQVKKIIELEQQKKSGVIRDEL